ncbi:MAG: Crp/Fnr family transcriptional regulator [Bacteroidetes bacterium]|nr:MAG: Crp/Fnr family transcriptional regulator [Bacteroidota bacterium]TNE98404.1 MAG: Crp/Fnr family transcriptional regulator [Bacteroidota bacterium]
MPYSELIQYFEQYVSLTEEEKSHINSSYKRVKLKKKDFLFKQGERCTTEAFVLKGTLRSFYVDSRGNEHVLNFALPGWWVGDLSSFYHGTDSFITVQALEDTDLLVIDPDVKEDLFNQIPSLERVFRIIVQKHLSSLQTRFLSTISETADQRYNNLLNKIPNIEQLVPQHQIASYLGILPESLSRMKKQLLEGKK